jgi:hypothetical protein
MYKDFLGSEIEIGEKGVRVNAFGHQKNFKKITVTKIDPSRKYGDVIGIITDGNSKIGYTYPNRVIVQKSLKIEL